MSKSAKGPKIAPMEFKNIVVAYDDSANSIRAVMAARPIALRNKAKLTIVSVYEGKIVADAGLAGGGTGILDLDGYVERGVEELQQKVKAQVDAAKADGITVQGVVLRKPQGAAQQILEYASSVGADLIVVGSRGLGGFKRVVLGSVSSAIVSHAECSVAVIR